MAHQCTTCGKTFGRGSELNRHIREKHTELQCGLCPIMLFGTQALEKHQKAHGVKTGFDCPTCGKHLVAKII